MSDRSESRKRTSNLMDDAQTLFLTSRPAIRYPIAIVLAGTAAYIFAHSPPLDMTYALVYLMVAAVYAWEVSAGLFLMLAIFGIFKFLATMPLAVALVVVIIACILIGF